MYETIRTAAEAIALGGALVIASLDFGGAHAQAMPSVVYPSSVTRGSVATAQRGRGGHFIFEVGVNGTAVPMVFDTGASVVSLRAEDAAAAGIDVSSLRYTGMTQTANGPSAVAPVVLQSITVGGITRRNVPGSVSKPGAMAVSLLGQSFNSRLAGYKFEGEQLVLMGGE